MNLESSRIRVRERRPVEVQDLTFCFLRANAKGCVALFWRWILPAGLLLAIIMHAAMQIAVQMPAPVFWQIYFAWLVLAVTMPIFRFPIICFAGQAVFVHEPDAGQALREAWQRGRGMLLEYVLWRGFLALTVVGLVVEWCRSHYQEEVVLLEQVPRKGVPDRLRQLNANARFSLSPIYQNALVGMCLVTALYGSVVVARLIMVRELELTPISDLATWLFACILIAQCHCAVAKFLGYLNHRTQYEGWDLFLKVRHVLLKWEQHPPAGASWIRSQPHV